MRAAAMMRLRRVLPPSTTFELLAGTKGSNGIDATVVASAAQRGDLIVTGDVVDLRRLAASLRNVTVKGLV